MSVVSPSGSLTKRMATASAHRAFRVLQVGMWALLAIILSLVWRDWHVLKARVEVFEQMKYELPKPLDDANAPPKPLAIRGHWTLRR